MFENFTSEKLRKSRRHSPTPSFEREREFLFLYNTYARADFVNCFCDSLVRVSDPMRGQPTAVIEGEEIVDKFVTSLVGNNIYFFKAGRKL